MSDNKAEVIENNEIEIIEPVIQEEKTVDITVLDPLEQEMAKKLGITPKEEVKKEEKLEKKDFEEVEKNEKEGLKDYSKNEQALYFKWKQDKKARQEAQAERDLTKVQQKALNEQLAKANEEGTLTKAKLKSIETLLSGPSDEITVEAIQAILKTEAKKIDDSDKPLTKKDLEEMAKANEEKTKKELESNKQFITRMNTLEEYGKTKFDNYDEIVDLAKEVIDGKIDLGVISHEDLAARLVAKINDANSDEDDVADYVLGIAKLNPKFGKSSKKEVAEGKEKRVSAEEIDKIVKNAGKSQTAVNAGGNGRRVVTHDTITLEDASKLTTEQWKALPDATRKRLLSQ